MKVYGLKIGNTGVEFSDRTERERAMLAFTKGATVKISTYGIKYEEGDTPFGTYERDTREVTVTCQECKGAFSVETAPTRKYPNKLSYSTKWETAENHICDGCFAAKNQEKKVADAQTTLETARETVDA